MSTSSSLTRSSLTLTQVFAYSRPDAVALVGNLATPTVSQAVTLAIPTNVNQVYVGSFTIAASAHQDVDFSSWTNLVYESISPTGLVSLLVIPTGTNAKVAIAPAPANTLNWFFGGTSPTLTVPTGGFFAFGQPTAQAVSGSAGTMRFSNTGSGSLTLLVLAFAEA